MAVLGATSLTGCLYIESFLGGTDPGTSAGFKSVFENASAPTSWTKDTSFSTNGIALRVVTGSLAPGGSLTFPQVFIQRGVPLSINQVTASVSLFPNSAGVGPDGFLPGYTASASAGAFSTNTASVADIPRHRHQYQFNTPATAPPGPVTRRNNLQLGRQTQSSPALQNGQHSHALSISQHQHEFDTTHEHPLYVTQHAHTVPGPGTQENFNISYRDVIIAEKQRKP
jgi:hypothetical protein